ncbi:galactose mutarotase, aldose 1-epimerase [Rodentibacter pneumotropicus]|uniref:Aldose 1-epimerase n=1 Tax=Rodentibacter pneumotropicus TaxID=758 RepID=A0A3S4TZD1_9PAST|nr:galactose mutarotase, aldose 1-epimerase [Rodentibacter pneumotropicus]
MNSADGEQGFPGNVNVTVIYTLTDDNAVKIEYEGLSDKDTALNLTNHAYFNLENAEQGTDIREHRLRLNADFYLPVNSDGIPNSPLKHVVGTSFDFRLTKQIKQDFCKAVRA